MNKEREFIEDMIYIRKKYPNKQTTIDKIISSCENKLIMKNELDIDSYLYMKANLAGINPNKMHTHRNRELVYSRYACMAILKENTLMTLSLIGRKVGNKDHTTVLNGLKQIELAKNGFNDDLLDEYRNACMYFFIED